MWAALGESAIDGLRQLLHERGPANVTGTDLSVASLTGVVTQGSECFLQNLCSPAALLSSRDAASDRNCDRASRRWLMFDPTSTSVF